MEFRREKKTHTEVFVTVRPDAILILTAGYEWKRPNKREAPAAARTKEKPSQSANWSL